MMLLRYRRAAPEATFQILRSAAAGSPRPTGRAAHRPALLTWTKVGGGASPAHATPADSDQQRRLLREHVSGWPGYLQIAGWFWWQQR